MIKSVSIEKLFTDRPFYDRFRAVRDAGFDHLEFTVWTQYDLDRVDALLKEFGLTLASMSGDRAHSIIHPDERQPFLDFLAQSLDAANRLRCGHLVIHSNAIDETGKMSERTFSNYAKIASATRTLMEAAKMAESAGVTLLLEAVSTTVKAGYYLHTSESTGDIVRVVDSPRVRLLYDVYHMQLMEGNITNTLRKYHDILAYVHIADVPGRHEPGTGEINFASVKKVLFGELGFAGVVGFEMGPAGELAECVRAMREF